MNKMFFNEDTPITEVIAEPKKQEVATSDIDEITPLECGNNQPCKSCDSEDVDLDFDEISPLNQTAPEDGERDEYQDELFDTEDVDLDFDEISPLNQTTGADSKRSENQGEVIDTEDVDLDFDEISPLNQTTPEDGERDEYQDEELEVIKPISLEESAVRIFSRSTKNIILESDFNAVRNYYDNSLSEETVLDMIAEAHNIDKDSLYVLVEDNPINLKNKVSSKKPEKKTTGIDRMIEALRQKKAKMTPEQWKNSGNADKLKRLLAQRTLKTTS